MILDDIPRLFFFTCKNRHLKSKNFSSLTFNGGKFFV